jgi:hypothetical protein
MQTIKPKLTVEQIIAWAKAHRLLKGNWPSPVSGPIPEAPGESWSNVLSALRCGRRGLPGGKSLGRLLTERLGERPRVLIITVEQILAWADAHHARLGVWPTPRSGIVGGPGLTWWALDTALRRGYHGLGAGSSLQQLLEEHRGVARGARRLAWTAEEDELLRTLADTEVASRTGRTLRAVRVRYRRLVLGLKE